jgi:hypothetical protein
VSVSLLLVSIGGGLSESSLSASFSSAFDLSTFGAQQDRCRDLDPQGISCFEIDDSAAATVAFAVRSQRFFRGTFLPFLRALESAMAIAYSRLFTLPPCRRVRSWRGRVCSDASRGGPPHPSRLPLDESDMIPLPHVRAS